MTQLTDYQAEVADLLHDPSQAVWTLAQLTNYINRARTKLVTDTGCLRSLQTTYVMQAVEAYVFGSVTGAAITAGGSAYTNPTASFSGGGGSGVAATLGVSSGAVTSISFTNNGSGYTTAPAVTVVPGGGSGATITAGVINVNTYDILGVSLIWGNQRVPLLWRPWSEFSVLARTWVGVQYRPRFWSCYGESTVYVGPLPDQTYQVEIDTVILPTALVGLSDVDAVPVLMQPPIAYKAAQLAKFNAQRYGEAATFEKQYMERLLDVNNAYVRRITSE